MAPNQSAGSMGASTGFYSDSFMHMDHSKKQMKHSNHTGADSYGRVELYYDEGIDDKAASYISGVRKRFSLERGD
ncbi:hypothetical protein COLO4_07124 [Corchorus olitorius]|uniref:Uncharacterized protein n=1 Tax=Corchorus olitorius TaxID=93759 RepID=A0A1R3KKR8_9ROSI|nr:hypothetical protein COLO4_07124 [Corchorus olitorius]